MEIRLLGPVELHTNGHRVDLGPRRQRLVLAVLALEVNRLVAVDHLVALTWPDEEPPRTAVHAIRVIVSRLRAVLAAAPDGSGPLEISTRGSGYVLRGDPALIDASRFLELLGRARVTDDHVSRIDLLTEALDLWSGPALAGVASAETRDRLSHGLEEARLSAYRELVESRLALGEHAQLVPQLERLTTEHPYDEQLHGQWMLALYRAGRQADALAAYRALRRVLDAELGIEPSQPLRDLESAILRQDRGLDLAAPPGQPVASPSAASVPAQLPPASPAFVGRSEALASLDTLLARADAPVAAVITAVSGTAGIGKTSLAIHWAHRIAPRYPDGQLYVNLRGFDPTRPALDPADAVRDFLGALGVPAERVPAGLEAQTALYRSLLAGKRALIVLDNARDAEQVRPLLPGAPGCLTVVTSRNQLAPLVAIEGAHTVVLDYLTDGEARELLTRRLGPARLAAEPDAVADIAGRCAGLPLALAVVAARAATRPDLTLTELATELRDTAGGLDALQAGDTTTDVRAVFSWSYQALGADAARLFRLLGLHPGPDVSVAAAASIVGLSASRVRPLLVELTNGHLLTEHTRGRYTVHDLMRAFAVEQAGRVDCDEERRGASLRMLDHYLHSACAAALILDPHRDQIELPPAEPGVTPEEIATHDQAMAWFTAERAVLLAAMDHAADTGFDAHIWRLAWALADVLNRQGRFLDFIATQHAALTAGHRLRDPVVKGRAHRILGRAYLRLRRADQARDHLEQSIEMCREAGDRLGEAHAHLNISGVFSQAGRQAEALSHAQQSLALFRAVGHTPGLTLALNSVGWCHAQLGQYPEALDSCQQALILMRVTGDRPGQAATWDSLGYIHRQIGNYAQAVASFQYAIDLCRDLGDRFEEATSLTNLGDAHVDHDLDQARAAWHQALVILDELCHPDAYRVRVKLRSWPVRRPQAVSAMEY